MSPVTENCYEFVTGDIVPSGVGIPDMILGTSGARPGAREPPGEYQGRHARGGADQKSRLISETFDDVHTVGRHVGVLQSFGSGRVELAELGGF
jgi:hypothetical protein